MKLPKLQLPWLRNLYTAKRHMSHSAVTDMLRTPFAILCALIAALAAQLPHAADVFRLIVHAQGEQAVAHSYLYAMALETAILLFVVNDRRFASYMFAGVSVAANLSYYHINGVPLFTTLDALPAWLVSFALPVAIAQYSHLLAGRHGVATKEATAPASAQKASERPASVASAAAVSAPSRIVHSAKPPGSVGVPDDDSQDSAEGVDKAERARQLFGEGLNKSQIARELGVHRNTVRGWLEQTNGVAQ